MTNKIITGADKIIKPLDRSYIVIPILDWCKGRQISDIVGSFISAHRPSALRVSHGEVQTDWKSWRVTVYVDDNQFIRGIEQEVEVLLPQNCQNGAELIIMGGVPFTLDEELQQDEPIEEQEDTAE